MWYVVVFPEENTVSTVPKSWYIESSKECFWPPSKKYRRTEIEKLVRYGYLPEDNWKPYEVRVLAKYDDYKEAMRKLSKAKEKDFLSSTDQEAVEGKRRRKKFTKYDDYETDEDDADRESEDSISFPAFPDSNVRKPEQEASSVNKNMTRMETKSSCFQKKEHCDLGDLREKLEAISTAAAQLFINKIGENSLTMEKQNTERSREKKKTNFYRTLSRSLSPDVSCINSKNPPDSVDNSRTIMEFLKKMQMESNEFKIQIIRKLNLINMKLNDLETSLESFKNKELQNQIDPDEMNDILHLFPLSKEKLDQVEADLLNEEFQRKLAKHLSRVGGVDTAEIVKRLMYKLFTNELGNLFSWDGAKGKEKFKHLRISNVILNAVRLNIPTTTESEVIIHIKKWLVRCRDRIQAANKRIRQGQDENEEQQF